MASGDYSIIFDTGEPAYAVDRNGTIVAWNAAATSALGYSDSQAVGKKCWSLLQGHDAFGNQYCCERCPLREMAAHHKPVNRCRMYFRTAEGKLKAFTVSTLVLFGRNDWETLIHLCRKEPDAAEDTPAFALPRQSSRGDSHGVLTPRESQVLKHLCDGYTTGEIATLLSISVPTVRNHVEHILHKLHAHSRLEAVAVGRRLGLV
jgi:PAS domain S-box-containing protein